MLQEVVIVSAARTPIADFMGSLQNFSAIQLGTAALKESMARARIEPDTVEEVLAGNCLQAGSPGNVARHIQMHSGIPAKSTAMTVNQQCPSSMRATEILSQQIMLGKIGAGAVVGTESMTNAPYLLLNARKGYRLGPGDTALDSMLHNGLVCGLSNGHMGITAENVAQMYRISRQEQDELALMSNQRAMAAIREGRFKEEIFPIEISGKKGTVLFDTDEHPKDTSLETLGKLRPAFRKDGTVTAGNSSGINDGAAAMVIMTAEKAKELGCRPIAKIKAVGYGGCHPSIMGMGPAPAVRDLMKRSGLKLSDFQLIELNEAFAGQYLGCEKELGINREITNVNGSGCGLGHPVGATGCRIMVTLLHAMKKRGKTLGLATLCGGGGVSMATALEMV